MKPEKSRGRRGAWLTGLGALTIIAVCWYHREAILRFFQPRIDFHVRDGEWPMLFGSPSRNPVSPERRSIPHEWNIDTGENIKWVAQLGSQSYGNPVVAEGRVFVGTNNATQRNPKIRGDKGILMCLREVDGGFLWQAVHDKLASGRVNDWPEQGIASSPVVENGRLWYVSNRCELVCADVDGFLDGDNDGPYVKEKYSSSIDADFIWVLDMMADLGVFPHNLATSSPLIHGDLVFLITGNGVDEGHIDIPSPGAPSILAVDKRTGEIVWQRNDPGLGILHGQWSSPSMGVAGGRLQVVFPCGDGWLYSCDPMTGDLIWKFDGNPQGASWTLGGRGTKNNIVAPVAFVDDRVYLAMGQEPEHGEGPGHLYSIDASGKGDVTSTKQVWHYRGRDFTRSISTPAVHDGLVYAVDLGGFLHCVDQDTGEAYWTHDTLAAVWASPLVADGKVFIGDEDGDLEVLRTGKSLVKLAEYNFGNSLYMTPVVANGVLYITSRTTLYAIADDR